MNDEKQDKHDLLMQDLRAVKEILPNNKIKNECAIVGSLEMYKCGKIGYDELMLFVCEYALEWCADIILKCASK